MPRLFVACAVACLCWVAFAPVEAAGAQGSTALVFIGNAAAGPKGLTKVELAALLSRQQKHWNNGKPAIVLNFPARHNLRVQVDKAILGLGPRQTARYWIDRRIRGAGSPPRSVSSSRLMARVVAKLPGALGYVFDNQPHPGTTVLGQLRNGKYTPGDGS